MARQGTAVLEEDDGDADGLAPLDRAAGGDVTVDLPEGVTDRGGAKGDRVVGGNLDLRGADGQSDRGTVFEIVDDEPAPGGQTQTQTPADERVGEHDASGAPAIEAGRGADAPDGQRQPTRKQLQRQRRREGRDRTLSEVESLRIRVQELEGQVGGIEPRLSTFDKQSHEQRVTDLNRQITEATNAAVAARRQMVQAQTDGDHEAAANALDARDAAMTRAGSLTVQRNLLVSGNAFDDKPPADGSVPRRGDQQQQRRETAPAARQQQPAPIPPAVRENINDFAEEFPWYDPANKLHAASQAVLAIDYQVANEGYDPAGPDYWDRMRELMREELPARYLQAEQGDSRPARRGNGNGDSRQDAPARRQAAAPARRGPSMGAPADGGGGQSRTKVSLTKERKESLVEMGVIASDGRTVVDQPRFMRMLKQYSQFDAANQTARQ